MDQLQVTVETPPRGLGGNSRLHNLPKARLFSYYKGEVLKEFWAKYGTQFPKWQRAELSAVLTFPVERRRDQDNYTIALKPVADAIVHLGIVPDDNADTLTITPPRFVVKAKARPLATFTLRRVA